MQPLSHKKGKVGSKDKPNAPLSPPNENILMQTFYDQDKSKKVKKEKDNLRDFYKPL